MLFFLIKFEIKMQPSTITQPARIHTVDALRGFALLGIMIVHFLFWYTAGPLPQEVYGQYNDVGTKVATIFSEIFLSGKFFAFFSFLFGLSFYLQTGERGSGNVVKRFAWRIVLLLVIGLVHHAFWQGDILSIYAPLGLLLLLSRRLSNKWVLVLALLLVINLPGKVMFLSQMLNPAPPPAGPVGNMADIAGEYQQLINTGSWLEIFQFNLSHLKTKFDFQIGSGRLFVTLGFFLLGMYIGRKKWFEKGTEAKPTWRKLFRRSAAIAGTCLLIGLSIFAANEIGKPGWEQNPYVGFFFSFLIDIFSAGLVALYVSGLTLLMLKASWQRYLYTLAPVGKMALTSYLTQTLVGLLLFWNVGLGLYSKTSPGLNFLIAAALFYLQVVISRRWLQSFRYGPVEWAWRSATLLKVQPMKRQVKTGVEDKERIILVPSNHPEAEVRI